MLVVTANATWRLNWIRWHVYAGVVLLAFAQFQLSRGCFGRKTPRSSNFLAYPSLRCANSRTPSAAS
jgi:hypothetical protein